MNTDKTIKEENARIPVRVQTQKVLREIAFGMGATYDDLLWIMIDRLSKPDETPIETGRRLKEEEKAQ